MGLAQSPSIATNGLVFYYDMYNTKKSYRGEPTTNQFAIPTPDGNGNVSFAVNGTGTFQRVYAGTFGNYDIQPTDIVYRYDLGANGCHYHGNDVTITAGLFPTFTFDYYLSPDVSSFNDTFMANFENLGSGVGGSAALPNLQKGVWQTIQINGNAATATSGLRMLLYPGGCSGGRLAATGFILMKNPQVTFSSTSGKVLPFVAGTRYANSNLESSPSYPSWNTSSGSSYSGGTLTFASGSYNSKGGWDLYKTYTGLSTSTNYTWSALVKLGTASNLIITMNNTQAWNTGPSTVVAGLSSTDWTRVAITGTTNTGSFNLHLGASNNTEVTATVQSAGTVFIQDVRLVLSQSQTAISDMMDKNTINASSLTYNSDGTFSFNGSGNYLSIPDNALIRPSSGFITTEIWFKSTSTGGQNASILINKENEYEISAGGGVISYAFRPNWAWVGATAYNLNQIYCVTITYDQSYQRMYLNGVQVYNAALSGAIGNIYSDTLKIGARGGAASTYDYFPGYIYNVKIYDRGLSVSEVLQNFNAQRGLYGV